MESEEIEARVAIQAMLGQYIRCVDSGRAEGLAALFTEETEYDMSGGIIARTRAQIVEHVEQLKLTFSASADFGRLRHHNSSLVVEVEDADHARATSYYVAFAAHGPDHWGVYRDRLVRTADGWRFAQRRVTVEGAVGGSPVRAKMA